MQPRLPFEREPPGGEGSRSGSTPGDRGPGPGATAGPSGEYLFVRNNRAKRYIVRVRGDGTVRVTLPRRGSKKEAQAFAEAQRPWIEQQRAKVAGSRMAAPAALAPDVERELRRRAVRDLPPRLRELAALHALAVEKVSVRNQRWRWGSCSRGGHICLNWRLILMPDWVRDYVLLHELMHLKRMDHSPKFWRLVAAACPDYQRARAWLRHYQPS